MNVLACLVMLLAAPTVDELQAVLKKHARDPRQQGPRAAAIRQLGDIGSAATTRALEAMLADPYVHLRDEAEVALARLRLKSAAGRAPSVALLGELLGRRTDPETQQRLARALGLIGDRAATPALLAALGKSREAASVPVLAEALARLGDERAMDALREKARTFPEGRAACVRALGRFPNGGDLALAYKEDPDDAVRAAVVDVCVLRKLPVLPRLAVGPDTGERTAIALADALPAMRPGDSPRLRVEALLTHPSWRARAAAIAGVVAMRDPTLLPDLVKRLEEEEGRLKVDAWNALRALTGRNLHPEPERWRALLPLRELPERNDVTPMLLPVSKRVAFVTTYSSPRRPPDIRHTLVLNLGPDRRYDLFYHRLGDKHPPRPRLERCFGRLVAGRKDDANAWLKALTGRGTAYEGLLAAMADPDVDTVYLLSDGILLRPAATVLEELRRRNRWRRVVIHVIGDWSDREVKERLARESGGVTGR